MIEQEYIISFEPEYQIPQGFRFCTVVCISSASTKSFLSNCMLLKTYKVYSLLTDTIITLSVGQNQGDEYLNRHDNQKRCAVPLLLWDVRAKRKA